MGKSVSQLPVIMSKTIDIEWKQKLAEQIKQARESANLTQDELAKMLGISRQMVINYEKNKGVPAINVLAQIAVELEIRLRIKDIITSESESHPDSDRYRSSFDWSLRNRKRFQERS